MHSHRFDPVSAVLGLIALVAGVLTIAGSTVPFDGDVGPWLAVVALAFGVLVLPWGLRGQSRPPADSDPDEFPLA